jgi:hypothetical protein
MDISSILSLHQQAKAQGKQYAKKRFIYDDVKQSSGRHFIAILGPRGAGKTILLKQLICENEESIYISLDSLEIEDLFETIKILAEDYKYKVFFLDEIHAYHGYAQALKKIYDFLSVRVIFTSSMAISIKESTYDLSRRIKQIKLYSFSFREYVYFKTGTSPRQLSLDDIARQNWSIDHVRNESLFKSFLKGGCLPFSLEEPQPLALLQNILEKIISWDIPMVKAISQQEVEIIRKMVRFIGSAKVEGISYSALSNNLGITKYKAEQYVRLLQDAFVLQVIFPKGANVLKEPKIIMFLPYRLLYQDYAEAIGGLREDFFVEMMLIRDIPVYYLKSKQGAKTPDYLIDYQDNKVIIEVGGKGKGRTQFKGIKA